MLILDEPTSMLTPQGIAELQKVLPRSRRHGLAIIFITHKLHEAVAIGDRITMLRQGAWSWALEPPTLVGASRAELQARIVAIMFGDQRAASAEVAELRGDVDGAARTAREIAERPMLELDVSAKGPGQNGIEDVTLGVRAGEILGIAGVDGNGQRALAEVIAGQRRVAAGEIRLEAHRVTELAVSDRQRLGLRYVTDDRLGEGVVGAVLGGDQHGPQADRRCALLAPRHHRPCRDPCHGERAHRRVRHPDAVTGDATSAS